MSRSYRNGNLGGPGLKKPSPTTVPVNGQRLQKLRQLAGMTQEQLAEKAGYSERLVRKAEASSPLRKSTIADLAAALSSGEQRLTVDDLVFSHESVSTDMAAFLLHGSMALAESFQELIHPRFTLTVAGHELNIPFAGTHSGPSACDSFRDQFRGAFESIHYQPTQTHCFAAAHETCVQAITELQSSLQSLDQPITTEIWWFLKARFEASRLISVQLHYDTGNVCRLLGCL